MSFQIGDAARLSPPFRLVAAYFITSLVFFAAGVFLTFIDSSDFLQFYFQPHILAITHTLALGWVTMIISGAMFQLMPVVFRVRVFSTYLAYVQIPLLAIGTAGMAYGFYKFNIGTGFVIFASLAYTAVVLFVVNILVTMSRIREWNLTGVHFVTGMFFLFVAVSVGLTLALNLRYGFLLADHLEILKAHAHIAVIGFVTMIVFGAVYQLIPMFALSYDYPKVFAWIAYVLTVAGLIGYATVVAFFGGSISPAPFSVIMAGGIAAFLAQVVIIFKKRFRKKLDAGLKQTALSFGFLGLAALLTAAAGATNILDSIPTATTSLSVGFLVFFGYIGTLILGQMLKIGPFLVWLHKYSQLVGISDVPSLHDMVDQRLAYAQFVLWGLAVPVAAAGILFSSSHLLFAGSLGMLLSAIIYLIIQYKVFTSNISAQTSGRDPGNG